MEKYNNANVWSTVEVAVFDAAVVQLLRSPQSSIAPELGTASDAVSVWICEVAVSHAAVIQLLEAPQSSIAPELGTASDAVYFWVGVDLWRQRCSMLLLQLL